MCVYSMIVDHYSDKWDKLPKPSPWRLPPVPGPYIPIPDDMTPSPVRREPPITDAEIREFRELLERAREYDKRHNEPDCELEEKRQRILKLAEELGVDIEFVKEKK